MVEGGKIDWACHSNDGATMVKEVMDFSDAVEVVLEFLPPTSKETLIIVTADHETGGRGTRNSGIRVESETFVSTTAFFWISSRIG